MRKVVTALLLSSMLGLGLVAPAAADSWTWRDRSGGRGPLAIRSIKVGHRFGGPRLVVNFDRPLKPSRMGPKDFIVLDYDENGKRPSEGWIYVVARRGRLDSFEYSPITRQTYGGNGFTRPTPRSLELVPMNYQGGYAVAAASYSENAAAGCSGGCWDFAPNRGYVVHDWSPPTFKTFVAPEPYDEFWYEPEVPITWRATDTGLSGLARTSVVWREPEATRGRTLVTRRGGGRQEANVDVVEGAHMLLQGAAEDGAGNTGTSYSSLLRIPFDDANESGPGAFSGAWTRQEDPEASHGSLNVGTGPAAMFTFADTGNQYCVVVKWLDLEPAQVRIQAGDGTAHTADHDAGDPGGIGWPVCASTESIAEQTATFVVLAGRAGVDGYWAGDHGAASAGTASMSYHDDRLRRRFERRPSLHSLRKGANSLAPAPGSPRFTRTR